MSTTTTEWLGNHVRLEPIEDTDLTLVQWRRPHHGSWRGARIMDTQEMQHVGSVLDTLAQVRCDPASRRGGEERRYLRDDLAGSPLHLESLLTDLLDR